MDDVRYNQIDKMLEDELSTLSDAEYREYSKLRYKKQTDPAAAFAELLSQIETAQQGYLNVWQTGFKQLDEKLDGGFLKGNLIVLGAVSSLGKTTFALQIADQMAAFGDHDVLVFSLEMSKSELLAKSISRNTFNTKKPEYRLTMGDIIRGRVGAAGEERRKVFDEALEVSKQINEHIYILRDNEMDIDKIAATIQAHIDLTKRRPFVIIDYLQILKARQTAKTTDKRLLTDDDVNRLKDLAEKMELPIMAISSFNRNNYLEPANMGSFKESGTIEYSADTLIALQYTGMQYIEAEKFITKGSGENRKVEKVRGYETKAEHEARVRKLVDEMDIKGAAGNFLPIDVILLKNRGVSKGKIRFEFCPKYNIFREMSDQRDPFSLPDENTGDYDIHNLVLPANKKNNSTPDSLGEY